MSFQELLALKGGFSGKGWMVENPAKDKGQVPLLATH